MKSFLADGQIDGKAHFCSVEIHVHVHVREREREKKKITLQTEVS